MFVPKPPVHIRFDEISCVNFARVQSGGGTSSRSFDFEVEHKNGSVITFSSIDKYVE
jgi:structure-specific recognition protein 1